MRIPLCSVLLLLILCGCGGGSGSGTSTTSTAPPPPPPVYPTISGNWSITALSTPTASTIYIGAWLNSASGQVTGILHILNSSCYQLTQDVPVSGTISTAGALSVTSGAVASQTIAVTGSISGSTLSSGSYTITGGCAAGDKGTVTGYAVPSFTNTWTGTFQLASGTAATATIAATQTGPTADGIYGVTGNATFAGSPCLTTGAISFSEISGNYFAVTITGTNGAAVDFVGDVTDATGKTIQGEYLFTAGSCAGATGAGTLTHP